MQKEYFGNILGEEKLSYYMQNGSIGFQPAISDIANTHPRAFVINLFHEYDCFRIPELDHNISFVSLQLMDEIENLQGKGEDDICLQKSGIDPGNYYNRFYTFLLKLRTAFPDLPIVTIKRLSHFPCLGKEIKSFLKGWDDNWCHFNDFFETSAKKLGQITVVDIDKIFAAKIQKGFLFEQLLEADLVDQHIHLKDLKKIDLEHLSHIVWDEIAEYLKNIISDEALIMNYDQKIPNHWYVEPAKLYNSLHEIEKSFHSGDLEKIRLGLNSLIDYPCSTHIKSDLINRTKESLVFDPRVVFFLKRLILSEPVNEFIEVIEYFYNHFNKTESDRVNIKDAIEILCELEKYIYSINSARLMHISEFKRIVLWGTGGRGEYYYEFLKRIKTEKRIVRFIDNNKSKWGVTKNNVPIYPPDQLDSLECDVIIIASIFNDDIKEEIKRLDVSFKCRVVESDEFLLYIKIHNLKEDNKGRHYRSFFSAL